MAAIFVEFQAGIRRFWKPVRVNCYTPVQFGSRILNPSQLFIVQTYADGQKLRRMGSTAAAQGFSQKTI
jgi:hypothetical protein